MIGLKYSKSYLMLHSTAVKGDDIPSFFVVFNLEKCFQLGTEVFRNIKTVLNDVQSLYVPNLLLSFPFIICWAV